MKGLKGTALRIYNLLKKESPLWTREIARKLNLAPSTVHYHLWGAFQKGKFRGASLRAHIVILGFKGHEKLIALRDSVKPAFELKEVEEEKEVPKEISRTSEQRSWEDLLREELGTNESGS